MRSLFLPASIAILACNGRGAPSPRPTGPATPVATPAPAAEPQLFDEASFLSNRGVRERLVIRQREDGWTYELEATVLNVAAVMRVHIEADRDGAIATAAIEMEEGAERVAFTLTRDGDELTLLSDGSTTRLPAAELYLLSGASIGQLAGLCIAPMPRTWTVFSQEPAVLGAAEPAPGGVTRARVMLADGEADLYCDGQKAIALDGPEGEQIVRVGSEQVFAAARRPPPASPVLPEGAVETERTVAVKADGEVEATTLACSFVTPASPAGKVPAVVLQNGNNGHDRDGGDHGKDPYERRWILRFLAYGLADAGIASLRCDARPAGDHRFLTLEAFQAHATAMLKAIAAESGVDRKRLGLFGIHEAASASPRVWKAMPVRAIVMLGADGRTHASMSQAMTEHAMRAAGADQVTIDRALDELRAVHAAIRDGKPFPAHLPEAYVQVMEVAREWIKSILDYDASVAAAKIRKTAVLVASTHFGHGSDPSDDDFDDVAALRKALETATGKNQNAIETKIYPLVDGYFRARTAGDEGRRSSWRDPQSTEVVTDVVDFLSRRLGASAPAR